MAKFRKKPVEIEAVKYTAADYGDYPAEGFEEFPQWLLDALTEQKITFKLEGEDYWYGVIDTLEGTMTLSPDDYLVRGVEGEIYPCKPEIFAKTYDPVD